MLAFELEGEVIGQMPALVVSAEQPERVGVPDLQGPQVQDTLVLSASARGGSSTCHTSMLKYPRST